jgi:hypothetical protein
LADSAEFLHGLLSRSPRQQRAVPPQQGAKLTLSINCLETVVVDPMNNTLDDSESDYKKMGKKSDTYTNLTNFLHSLLHRKSNFLKRRHAIRMALTAYISDKIPQVPQHMGKRASNLENIDQKEMVQNFSKFAERHAEKKRLINA